MPAKRVIHVIGAMNRGGAEVLLMNILRNVDRNQFIFDFAVQTTLPGEFDDEIRELGGGVIYHRHPTEVGASNYLRNLIKTLHDYGPYDAIHSHVFLSSGLILRCAASTHIPIRIAHSHSTSDGRKHSIRRAIYRKAMKRLIRNYATHMVGCSRVACESLYGSDCWKDARVAVIPNAIDLTPFATYLTDTVRVELGISKEAFLVGHVGRFVSEKNHSFIISVFSELLKRVPNARLILAGDGPYRTEMEAMCQHMGIGDCVRFLGIRTDVHQIMKEIDVFVMPSHYEGLGIVLIEAQAAGTPCIVSPFVPEEADLGAGLVQRIPIHSPSDWVGPLCYLSNTRSARSTNGLKCAVEKGYDITRTIATIQELYIAHSNMTLLNSIKISR